MRVPFPLSFNSKISHHQLCSQESRPGEPAQKRFSVDATSGDIIVSRQVEALTTYILNISAQDEGGLSTITQIILRINDTNNNRWIKV